MIGLIRRCVFAAAPARRLAVPPSMGFGRPVKVKVTKFASGALNNPKEEEEEEEVVDNFESEESNDIDMRKRSAVKRNKFITKEAVEVDEEAEREAEDALAAFEDSNELAELSNHEGNNRLRTITKEDDGHFSKEKVQFIKDTLMYEGDDPFYSKLVNRPEKGVVWGLGGELLR